MKNLFTKNIKITAIIGLVMICLLCINKKECVAQVQIGADIIGEAANDQLGNSVSMPNKNTICIGGWRNDGAGNSAGHARVYDWNGSAWVQRGADLNGVAAGDWFGYYVNMPDENTIAVTAPYGSNGAITGAGYVKIFTWNGSSWVQKGNTLYGTATNDYFGWMVIMPDADHFITSAIYSDLNGSNSGMVQVYDWNGTNWVQRGVNILGLAADDRYGWSVAMPTINTIAASATFNSTPQSNIGLVQIFDWNGTAWVQRGSNLIGEASGDQFGTYIQMPNENTICASARFNDGAGTTAGHTRVFTWNGTDWVQKGSDIDGEAAGDESGNCLWMPNADWIAVGAHKNDGNGVNSGNVRIYKWNGADWMQMFSDMDGEAADDVFGYSLCMPDTNTIAIGAIFNDANGVDAGEVKVFELTTLTSNNKGIAENSISYYPNPSHGNLTVENATANSIILITDLAGKVLYYEKVIASKTILNMENLSDGIYLMSIVDEHNTIKNSKLIIAK
jgi:hypothetical protein